MDALRSCGAGGRLDREGLPHDGIELRWDRRGHRIDFPALTGGRAGVGLRADRGGQGPDRAPTGRRPALVVRCDGTRRRAGWTGPAGGPLRPRRRGAHPRPATTSSAATASTAWCARRVPADRRAHLRARVSVLVARRARRCAAVLRGVDLRPLAARLRPAQHALTGGEPPLPPGAERHRPGAVGRPADLGRARRALRRSTATGRWNAVRSPPSPCCRCAVTSPSRCAGAGCCWPGTRRTSCRPPAPRASTSPRPT